MARKKAVLPRSSDPDGKRRFEVGDLVRFCHDRHGRRGVIYRVGQVHKSKQDPVDPYYYRGSRAQYTYHLTAVFGLFKTHVGLQKPRGVPGTELEMVDVVQLGQEFAAFLDFINDHVKARGKGVG